MPYAEPGEPGGDAEQLSTPLRITPQLHPAGIGHLVAQQGWRHHWSAAYSCNDAPLFLLCEEHGAYRGGIDDLHRAVPRRGSSRSARIISTDSEGVRNPMARLISTSCSSVRRSSWKTCSSSIAVSSPCKER